jgi:hypothetical protein
MPQLHVLVDLLVFDAPSYLAQEEMTQAQAEALNSEYKEWSLCYRWERCGDA